MKNHIVYILKCKDDTFYTGYTKDLKERVKIHNAGKGARYTRSRLPVKLVYYESFKTIREAYQREVNIKKLSREAKRKLIKISKRI